MKTDDRCDGELGLAESVDWARENTGKVHEKVMADSTLAGYEVPDKLEQEQRSENNLAPNARLAATEKSEKERSDTVP